MHKQSCTSNVRSDSAEENTFYDTVDNSEGSQLPHTQGPLYEEIQRRERQELIELKENVAYGPTEK
jgi:hypothetical protein